MGNQIHSIRELLHSILKKEPPRTRSRIQSIGDFRAQCTAALFTGAALFLCTIVAPWMLPAQTAAAPQTIHATPKPAVHASAADHNRTTDHRRPARHPAHPAVAEAPAPPPAPPKPNWPIDQPPSPARVTWDSHGLFIQASNSSLKQILQDIIADTGVKLQGLNRDERIFGDYGPGPAREVLSNLLDGSGYNVLMIGGAGDAPPQQIILSPNAPASPHPANAAQPGDDNDENQAEDQPEPLAQPEQPMPPRSSFGPGAQRVPLEMQQDMQIRQQQREQQQEQRREQQEQQQQQQENNPQE